MRSNKENKSTQGGLQATEVENLSVEVSKVKILGTPDNYISADSILSLIIDYAHQQNISTTEVLKRLSARLDTGIESKNESQPALFSAFPFLRNLTKPA